jgi:hypothetical protein
LKRLSERWEVEVHNVIVNEFMSLDGVAQAPGGAQEDTTSQFFGVIRVGRRRERARPPKCPPA